MALQIAVFSNHKTENGSIGCKPNLQFYKEIIVRGLGYPVDASIQDEYLSREEEIEFFEQLKALRGAVTKLEESGRGDSLDCKELQAEYHGLRNHFVLTKGLLMITLAKPYAGRGISLLDLVLNAILKCIDSADADGFDPTKNRFDTYVGTAVARELGRIKVLGNTTRHYPNDTLDAAVKVKKKLKGMDTPLTPEDAHKIADEVFPDIKTDTVRLIRYEEVMQLVMKPDKSVPDSACYRSNKTKEPWQILVERESEREENLKVARVHAALLQLDKEDHRLAVIAQGHLLNNQNFKEIGKQLDPPVSKQRVSQLWPRAEEKYHSYLLDPTLKIPKCGTGQEEYVFEKEAGKIPLEDFSKRHQEIVWDSKQNSASFNRANLELKEDYPLHALLMAERYPVDGRPRSLGDLAREWGLTRTEIGRVERDAFRRFKLLRMNIDSSANWNGRLLVQNGAPVENDAVYEQIRRV